MTGAPCAGSTHLLFPELDDGSEDLSAPAPEFCLSCPQALACLESGWTEKHGIWGGFTLLERRKAQKQGLNERDLWLTKFQSDT